MCHQSRQTLPPEQNQTWPTVPLSNCQQYVKVQDLKLIDEYNIIIYSLLDIITVLNICYSLKGIVSLDLFVLR